ncbi:hypothetical protein CY34DRAFT_800671 [Suillus luteus UH-Slu-Lm8-n1]|uniref:Unplaced genomic scaffold CY34scaffold_31, whole genome shotgun sequence n=1 Tax=Suillus luteus UH-Slu-Lm8-n1 TaxID=930992 RepID=A0A0D0B8M5_9AGAM|nr:hypothetical protein CY34DRAFT_800671 [Suillus luteus UH-Slu-Lm8-n1]
MLQDPEPLLVRPLAPGSLTMSHLLHLPCSEPLRFASNPCTVLPSTTSTMTI